MLLLVKKNDLLSKTESIMFKWYCSLNFLILKHVIFCNYHLMKMQVYFLKHGSIKM